MQPSRRGVVFAMLCSVGLFDPSRALAADKCRTGESAVQDARSIAALRVVIEDQCPCAAFDGLSKATNHSAFVKCAKTRIDDATDGTPLLGFSLRSQCKGTLKKVYTASTCGYPPAEARVACCEVKPSNGKTKAGIKKTPSCVDSASGSVIRHACTISPFTTDACSFDANNDCTVASPFAEETVNLPSAADPADTPGTGGRRPTNPKLLAQFGGPSFSLNNARYTRHHLASAVGAPDVILILIPGFEGGAGNFRILAQNLLLRAQTEGYSLEVWAYDRRSNQLEDLAGADVAELYASPEVALDWFFGGELTLPLHPALVAGPNRRAVFYDTQADVPFIANWTPLVFSRDIDAIVTAARAAAVNQNVFLGGHSAGTGFTARYAATDFNFTGVGPADPGYAKLRGLVLLEGGGGSTGNALSSDTLDRIEAKFDGGLYGAVRDNGARCVDGTTPCSIATEAADCIGQVPPKCTPATTSYAVSSLLNARTLAAGEVTAIQAILDPDSSENILRVDQGSAGNYAIAKVPDIANLGLLPRATAFGGLGNFLDDDGIVAGAAPFVSTSVGGPGQQIDGIQTWRTITEVPSLRADAEQRSAPDHAARQHLGSGTRGHAYGSPRRELLHRRHQLHRHLLPELGSQRDLGGGRMHLEHVLGRRGRQRVQHECPVQSGHQPRLDAAFRRPRPARHREPHAGREHRHPGDRFRRHQRSRAGGGRLHALRLEHRRLHRADLRRHPARRRCERPESGVSHLRRRERRLRGGDGRGLRARRHRDGGRLGAEPGHPGARRLPEAQQAVGGWGGRLGANFRGARPLS